MVIVSMAIWVTVSQEAVKPSKEINWRKFTILLSAGTLSALVIAITLFQKPDETGQSKNKWILTDPITNNQLKMEITSKSYLFLLN